MSIEVRVPTLGESVTEATVATWFKKPGDAVAADEMLCELETDKVTVEVPAPAAGTLGEIVAAEGETVGVDALLATIERRRGRAPRRPPAKRTRRPRPERRGDSVDVMVPTLGESVTEATVATWFKKGGRHGHAGRDAVRAGNRQGLGRGARARLRHAEPRSSPPKAAPSRRAASSPSSAAAPQPQRPRPLPRRRRPRRPPASAGGKDVANAPSAEKLMAEKGLDAASVQGTGRDGRIMKEDVLRKARPPPPRAAAPRPPQAPRAPGRRRGCRARGTGEDDPPAPDHRPRLKDAQNTAAMLTTYNEVDMTEVMALRNQYKDEFEKKHGVRLGFMSFFTKACCPRAERGARGQRRDRRHRHRLQELRPHGHRRRHAPGPRGAGPARRRPEELRRDREGDRRKGPPRPRRQAVMAEMQGGTFTISNGGVYGSLMSSPILNPPQSGILGMHKIQDRPMVVGGEIKIRPMMYLALSYDHRIVDGKGAVTFLVRVKDALEDPRRLLMDL
jgi:2-oxoglutarate dehydrogenase E2 component (dihydrolipoamide succinyltransferase)